VYAIGGALYYRRTDTESKFVVECSPYCADRKLKQKTRVKMVLADSLGAPPPKLRFSKTEQLSVGSFQSMKVAALLNRHSCSLQSLDQVFAYARRLCRVRRRRVLPATSNHGYQSYPVKECGAPKCWSTKSNVSHSHISPAAPVAGLANRDEAICYQSTGEEDKQDRAEASSVYALLDLRTSP
jgi:hypothetical protein